MLSAVAYCSRNCANIGLLRIQGRQIAEHHGLEEGALAVSAWIPCSPSAAADPHRCCKPGTKGVGQRGVDLIAHPMDGIDIGHFEQLGQGRLTGQRQDLRLEGQTSLGFVQNGDKGRQQGWGSSTCLLLHPAPPIPMTALLISIWAASQRANSLRAKRIRKASASSL